MREYFRGKVIKPCRNYEDDDGCAGFYLGHIDVINEGEYVHGRLISSDVILDSYSGIKYKVQRGSISQMIQSRNGNHCSPRWRDIYLGDIGEIPLYDEGVLTIGDGILEIKRNIIGKVKVRFYYDDYSCKFEILEHGEGYAHSSRDNYFYIKSEDLKLSWALALSTIIYN